MKLDRMRALLKNEIEKIHDVSLEILRAVDVYVKDKELIEYLSCTGVEIDNNNDIIRFPKTYYHSSCSHDGSNFSGDNGGHLAQHNAEILSSYLITQILRKGIPVIYSCPSVAFKMQKGNLINESPEMMLENAKEAETYLSKAAKKEILKLLETY